MPKKIKLELDLLGNAIDSLEEAIRRYQDCLNGNDNALKHAVLHLAHFAEVLLKYYVSKQHPLLIFINPSEPKLKTDEQKIKGKTIGYDKAICILENGGVNVPEALKEDIKTLFEKRNEITHYKVSIEPEDFLERIGKLIADINKFDRVAFNSNIQGSIDENAWAVIANTVKNIEAKLEAAENEADKKLDLVGVETIENCPRCRNTTVYVSEERDKIICSFCGYTDHTFSCEDCNFVLPIDLALHESLCNECAEKSDYGEYLYEQSAGK
jgi:hypothetical protein